MNDIALPAAAPRTGLAPRTYDELLDFADRISKSSMVPPDYRGRPENILLAVQLGSEVGLAPLQSLQSIAVINGRPSVFGAGLMALVRRSPLCEDIIESFEGEGDNLTAVCTAKRRGADPVTRRFSVSDAKKAGLWSKQGPWQQYPRRMLQARARGFALNDAFADLLKGLTSAEEAEDIPRAAIDITPQQSTKADLDQFAGEMSFAQKAPAETVDPETGEILDIAALERDARRVASDDGTAGLRTWLRARTRMQRDLLAPRVGSAEQPGELLRLAQDADAATTESLVGDPPDLQKPLTAPAVEPARDNTQEERPSLKIEPPLKSGKPDYKTWAVALFRPKVRQQMEGTALAYLMGDNETYLNACRSGGLSSGDLADLEDDIREAWERCRA